jgi:response regulator of citrate/malate metabolism
VIRTLVVDDDAHVADLHRDYVERVPGFVAVGVAHRGTEALESAIALKPELVLLDFYLPDTKGLDVCRALRARALQPVDVIAVTAARDVETVRQAVAQGVVQYLIKPFSFATFREKLERYATYRERLRAAGEADQGAVDELLGALRGSSPAPLPKGLSHATRDVVTRALREARTELSAVEVAQATGLSRVTARRYLEHLVGDGMVALSLRYGTTGRPEHLYRWSAGS